MGFIADLLLLPLDLLVFFHCEIHLGVYMELFLGSGRDSLTIGWLGGRGERSYGDIHYPFLVVGGLRSCYLGFPTA